MKSLIIFTIGVLFSGSLAFADDQTKVTEKKESKASEAEEAPSKPKISITDLVFTDSEDLNTSLALRNENGRYYLIIEVDHNLSRNQFVLRPADVGVRDIVQAQVVKENLAFGFKNKFSALLPLIEASTPENSEVNESIYSLPSQVNRTQQHIDITEVLKQNANSGLLIDTDGVSYSLSDVASVSFFIGVNVDGRPKSFETPSADLGSLKNGETLLVYGRKPVTEIPIKPYEQPVVERLKLSPSVLARYLNPVFLSMNRQTDVSDVKAQLELILERLPIEITKERLSSLAEEILTSSGLNEAIEVLLNEQANTSQFRSLNMCKMIL